MNIPVIFQFLKELSANNNREWFNAHREQYENARNEFENLLTVIISRISLFDESIRGIEARDCTKERNQTIADTMFIYNRATAFWQVAVIARPLPC